MPCFPNKFAGKCVTCSTRVGAGAGVCERINGVWTVRCAVPCQPAASAPAPAPRAAAVAVGNLTGILTLFDRARQHLKFPAIVLALTETISIRVTVAGDRAKVPGSLTVVDAARDELDGSRDWFGRILRDGTFEPSAQGSVLMPCLSEKLSQFAADPAGVAGHDGRLHGRCCFCSRPLSDDRSTVVGYGKVCAGRFGLAWGEREFSFEGVSVAPSLEVAA